MNGTLKKDEKNELLFFNEALEYFSEEEIGLNDDTQEKVSKSDALILREQMLEELMCLKELLLQHPDTNVENLSSENKALFKRFINYYSTCPVCNGYNHYFNLRNIFLSENQSILKDLIHLMIEGQDHHKKIKYKIGIPCCNCYDKYLKRD